MNHRTTFVVALALLMVTMIPSVAHSDCISLGPMKEAPRPDDRLLLFTGTVTQVEKVTVSFDVDRVWSGAIHRRLTIALVRPNSETTGASGFVKGATYLVVATDAGPPPYIAEAEVPAGVPAYVINACGPTGRLGERETQANIRNIGPGKLPLP